MSHADTIRRDIASARDAAKHLRSFYDEAKWWPIADRLQSLADYADALVAENQQQAQATKQLATNLADLQLRLIERNAENQQLRDALALADETIRGLADQQAMPDDFYQATLTRISVALSGTPSEDTE